MRRLKTEALPYGTSQFDSSLGCFSLEKGMRLVRCDTLGKRRKRKTQGPSTAQNCRKTAILLSVGMTTLRLLRAS